MTSDKKFWTRFTIAWTAILVGSILILPWAVKLTIGYTEWVRSF